MKRILHAITPGDHFSPRTGSAVPTVVHGLAAAAARDEPRAWRHSVVLGSTTMRPRYDTADVIEYETVPAPSRRERLLDVARGRAGFLRTAAIRYHEPMAEAIRETEPSIVLAHNAPVLPWILRDTDHRVVLYVHNELLRTYSKAEIGRMLATADAVVCVSEWLAERTRASLPSAVAARVRVAGNGVDCKTFVPSEVVHVADAGSASARPLRVMFVGRMTPQKGADVLLRAAALLDRTDVEFVLVGSRGFAREDTHSPYEERLRRLADAVPAVVRFEPFVDRVELPAIMREADVFVVPSRWSEASGLTVGEGLATGLPIVASRVGGIPEVVGSAGRLVAPGDPVELAGAIAELADDPSLRARLRTVARARALSHDWSWAWSELRGILDGL